MTMSQTPNKNRITLEQFRELINKLELETGLTKMEVVRNIEYILQQRKAHSEYLITKDNMLTKQEALKFIDQSIKKKVKESGGSKMEVSIEILLDFEDERQAGQNTISIWRNRDQPNEMHSTIFLNDHDYKRLQEIVVKYKLPIAEAYDKMRVEKDSEEND